MNRLEAEILAQNQSLNAAAKKSRRDEEVVTDTMIKEVQDLLRLFGIPFVVSPAEAEAQCARLHQLGLVDGVITDDSDVFLFGATEVYKNIFEANRFVERYKMSEIEQELGLTRDKCINMAMLLGSDYTDGVKGVGIVNAMEIVSAFPDPRAGLHHFRDWIFSTEADQRPSRQQQPPEDANAATQLEWRQRIFKYKHRNMRRKWELSVNFPNEQVIQAYLKPNVDSSEETFEWALPDMSALRLFCQEKLGWTLMQIDQKLVPVYESLTDGTLTQRRLQSYFNFDQKAAEIRSARLKQAVGHLTNGTKISSSIVGSSTSSSSSSASSSSSSAVSFASSDVNSNRSKRAATSSKPAGSAKTKSVPLKPANIGNIDDSDGLVPDESGSDFEEQPLSRIKKRKSHVKIVKSNQNDLC